MYKYFKSLLLVFIAAVSVSAVEASADSELSSVLKEVVEGPLSSDVVKVKFDVLDYEVKDNHIANMGISFKLDCPFVKLSGEVNARHPKLGSIYGPFLGEAKDAVLVGQFEVEMQNLFLEELAGLSDEYGSIEKIAMMKPLTMEMWEEIVYLLIGFQTQDDFSEDGNSLEARIARQNAEGLIEAFAVNVKTPGDVEGTTSSEFEFLVTLKNTKVEIKIVQIDPTMSVCIFDDEEQEMMLTIENLRKRDPATMDYVKSIMQQWAASNWDLSNTSDFEEDW